MNDGKDAVDESIGAEEDYQCRQRDSRQHKGEDSENNRRHATQSNQPPSPREKINHRCKPPQPWRLLTNMRGGSMAADIDEPLEPYAHDQPEYARAFETFVTPTDQKTKAIGWLTGWVNGLRSHGLFVDAGAGEGSMTAALAKLFDRTIAIEPNSALRAELARRCPEAEIVEAPIGEARIASSADFVLCSHVLYYIPQNDWTDTLERLTSWLGAY